MYRPLEQEKASALIWRKIFNKSGTLYYFTNRKTRGEGAKGSGPGGEDGPPGSVAEGGVCGGRDLAGGVVLCGGVVAGGRGPLAVCLRPPADPRGRWVGGGDGRGGPFSTVVAFRRLHDRTGGGMNVK